MGFFRAFSGVFCIFVAHTEDIMEFFIQLGKYFVFVFNVFHRPEKIQIWFKSFVRELQILGINSIGIVILVSVFIGAAITIQTGYNMDNPFFPRYLVSLTTRDTLLLEFSSTIIALILAGKVGSNIASEIGTMRVTEQIDALEIMGVNAASYLVSPKVFALLFFNPFLVIISMFVGLVGGWGAALLTGVVSSADYIQGIRHIFIPYYITYSVIKSLFFAFIIVTVAAFQGFYVNGGALDVGKASTKAVVHSSILVLLFDLLLTQILLS